MITLSSEYYYPDELEFQEENEVVALNFAIDWVGAEPEPSDGEEELKLL